MSAALAVSSVQYGLHHGKGPSPPATKEPPLGAVPSQPTIDTSGAGAAIAGLGALLGQISAAGVMANCGSEAVSTMVAAPSAAADPAPAFKPNLDALNRALAHYAAQSAARETVIALVKQ